FYNAALEIKSSSLTNKKANVLGVQFNYAILDVEFDSPLYKYDQLGCPNFNCTIEAIDCSCDYSNSNECPKTTGRNPSCPPCPILDRFGSSICNGGIKNVMKVVKDKPITLNINEPIQLRYKADASICEGLMVTSYPIDGYYSMSIGYTQGNQKQVIINQPEVYSIARMCPSDQELSFAIPDTWTRDTYFINIVPFGGVTDNVTLSLEITSKPVPILQSSSSAASCNQVLPTHKCINEGEVVTGTGDATKYTYYTFNVTKAATYTIRAPNLAQTIYLLADSTNQHPQFNGLFTDWNSLRESENYLTLYLEPSIIYISIYSVYQSSFSFSITSEGYKKQVKVSSLPPKASAYYMVGTSNLRFPTAIFQCDVYYLCYPFSTQVSYSDPNPLYPVPSIFKTLDGSNIPSFQSINYIDDTNENPINENSYQVSFLYSYKIGLDPPIEYSSFEAIKYTKLSFLSNLYDENNNVLTNKNSTTFEFKELECNYTQFKDIKNELDSYEEVLYNVTELDQLNSLRYKLDSLTIRNNYVGCTSKALDYLEIEYVLKNITSSGCHYDVGTDEYYSSPCCIKTLQYYQCCVPESRQENVTSFVDVSSNIVTEECSDPSCTEQIIKQYYGSLQVQDNCLTPPNTLEDMMSTTIQVLRQCKSVLEVQYCNSDDECKTFSGPDGVCDLFLRRCLPNFEYMDKRYLHCVFSQLDQSTIYKVLHKPFHVNESIIDEIYNSHLKDDITNKLFMNRKLMAYWSSTTADPNFNTLFYPTTFGLDKSMELVHDVKYDNLFDFAALYTTTNLWEIFGMCPFYSCYGYANSTIAGSQKEADCYNACNASPSFCGYCPTNETYCYFLGYDQSTCGVQDYCLYFYGYTYNGYSKELCEASGSCSVYCDYECKSIATQPYCIDPSSLTETDCLMNTNTVWDTTTTVQFCRFTNISTSNNCDASLNQIWVECESKNVDECTGPLGQLSGMCYISGILCNTEEECLNAGECSDSFYFTTENTQGYTQGLGLGKCVKKHQIVGTNVRCEFNLNGYTEQDSPMGCFSHYPQVSTRIECESLGEDYKWWSPSLSNKTKCLQEKGCSTYVTKNTQMLPYNKIFNEMDEHVCSGCSDNSNSWKSKYQWENKFKWTPGFWYKGVHTKGQWYDPLKFVYINKQTKTLDYQKIYDELVDSVNNQMADMVRCEYFCRQQRVKDNLDSISCSCSGDGGSECFKETALLLGQVKPCSGTKQLFSFDYGNIIFTNESVNEGCGNIIVSQYPKNIFTNTQDQHFPSNFVSYPKPDNFGIFNSKDTIIGTLIGDGIKLEIHGVQQFTICFDYDDNQVQNHKKYPIFDFASYNLEKGILFPLNISIYFSNSTGKEQLCADIKVQDPNINLFPANRMDKWEEENKTFFKSDVKGLLYALAAIFLAVSIYGFYQLVIVVLIRIKGIVQRFELVHLLIFMIFSFVTIRMVYFFLLPNGSLSDNSVADYILVILPTFFYFSCYTIVVVLWYTIIFIVLKVNSSRNLQKRVFSLLGIINLIIYILLVVVILVFNFTKESNSNSCGNRVIIDPKSSNSQKTVSILYAVIQALISLVIGAAFIYLGGSLYLAMKKVKTPSSKSSKHQQKIFLLTTICSAGFILHCIFILVIVGLKEPSVVFSFIGLILTEVIPSVTILYCYDQRASLSLDLSLS
ncbi:hypothetical protein DICPUDRAFT_14599, partial [Dictyostelium purpureum]